MAKPTILAVDDDRHDPVALVLVDQRMPQTTGVEFLSQAIELHLSPLSESDSQQLVNNLLEVAALPDPLRQLICRHSVANGR